MTSHLDQINGLLDLIEVLEEQLEEAVEIIRGMTYREGCTWGTYLKPGETCEEYKSREQGFPHPGCPICRAKRFLEQLPEKFKRV